MIDLTHLAQGDEVVLRRNMEGHLLTEARWVTAAELSRVFGVNQRALRARHGSPGLVSEFAISGNDGFLHVDIATSEEVQNFYIRIVEHSQAELARATGILRRHKRRKG